MLRTRKPLEGESLQPRCETALHCYSAFTQQELCGLRPLLTPQWLISTGCAIGCIFIPIGAVCLAAAFSVVELPLRYDNSCVSGSSNSIKEANLQLLGGAGTTCNVQLEIPKTMRAPIFFYYGLDNFQQNHRRYVKSRSDPQIRGAPSAKTITYCEPEAYLNGNTTQLILPCGLAAWSLFNDTFLVSTGGVAVAVDETGISWSQDREHKYAAVPAQNFNINPAERGGATIPGTLQMDEHFIVWMRPATMPNFRKLWGRILQTLPKGTVLNVTITNRYNTYRFGGRKHIILSTASWLGGRNDFLGSAYLAVGGSCLLFSAVLLLLQLLWRRKLGDLSRLSWNRPATVGVPRLIVW